MKLVIIDEDNFVTNIGLALQYLNLRKREAGIPTDQNHATINLGNLEDGKEMVALLVDDGGNKVYAGVTLRSGDELKDGEHLPESANSVGVVSDLVASSERVAFTPQLPVAEPASLQLQKQLLKAFQAGKLPYQILATEIDPLIASSLHEAANTTSTRFVVRNDLGDDANPDGRRFFVAAARDNETLLVPPNKEGGVVNEDQLSQLAGEEVIRQKTVRRTPHPRTQSAVSTASANAPSSEPSRSQ